MVNSKIEWCSHTLNPWMGCTKVSEGCTNCYAEASECLRLHKVEWGKGKPRKRTSKAAWNEPLKWEIEAKETGKTSLVFCASLADVFDEEVEDGWRDDLFALIRSCPSLRWLLLTKRPKSMLRYKKQIEELPQIWIGTTAENQKRFDERVPDLLKIKSPVRFVSMEPLLGPVVVGKFIKDLQWIIVGGESTADGKSARPMKSAWATHIRDECVKAKVPFFFKQWGGPSNPEKKARGKQLDGRRWTEYPAGISQSASQLIKTDQDLLKKLEQEVTDGVKASITAAKALHRIYAYKDGLLWKSQNFSKFQEYCLVTWKYASAHSYRLAEAGGFVLELENADYPKGEKMPLPKNEAQIRPVLELPKERRVEFWKEKIIDLGPDQITTKTVSNKIPKVKRVKVAMVKTPAELKTRAVLALSRFTSTVKDLPNAVKIQSLLKKVDKLLK